MAQAATSNLTNSDSLNQLIQSQSNKIPDRVEYALYSYVSQGQADPVAIQRIVDFYASGNIPEAQKAVDMLDNKLDGMLFNVPLNGPTAAPVAPGVAIEKETLG